MSIAIATHGMFNPGWGAAGGGAPAMPPEYIPRPTLLVTNVEYVKRKDEDNRPIKIIIKDVQ